MMITALVVAPVHKNMHQGAQQKKNIWYYTRNSYTKIFQNEKNYSRQKNHHEQPHTVFAYKIFIFFAHII